MSVRNRMRPLAIPRVSLSYGIAIFFAIAYWRFRAFNIPVM